jgi:multicomponent Na+:H+ antiporter subunit G|tara:strand:- start:81 stop:401 length:321 start_codon:yes stop_codon:yes gene_type:complete
MDLVLDIITSICFFVGSLSIIIGACGLIKLPDVFSRIHAAGMIDTGGTAFFLLGMILQAGWSLITFKLILIGIFIFFTSPVTSHVTANLARQKNLMPLGKKIGKLL